MNKREFKKYVDALGAAVINEMLSAYYNVENVDQDKLSSAIETMLRAVGNAKINANITFDMGPGAFSDPKEYGRAKRAFFVQLFDKIDTEFEEATNPALKLFNEALPADEKARNKEIAAEAAK